MPLHYKYEFTKGDYSNYYNYIQFETPSAKKKWKNYYRNTIISFIVVSVILFSEGFFDFANKGSGAIFFAIIILIALIQVLMAKYRYKKQVTQIVANPENSNLFRIVELSFSNEGIFMEDETMNCNYKWNSIIRKNENNSYYFLFISSLQAIIIPKRIFKNPEEKQLVVDLFAKHISLEADITMKQ
jgi:hypothetical protein